MKKLMVIAVAVIALLTTACFEDHRIDLRAKLLVDNSSVFLKADSSLHLAVGDTIILEATYNGYENKWNDWNLDEASVRPEITSDSLYVQGRRCFIKAVVIKVAG